MNADGKFHPIYNSWYAMKQRCSNPNNVSYKNYGDRGITYCRDWEFFDGFLRDMSPCWKEGLTLNRIDNDKGYSRENCNWVTRKEQNINKRVNHVLEYRGRKMTMPQWAEYLGISFGTLRSRFYRGMTTSEILNGKLFRPHKL